MKLFAEPVFEIINLDNSDVIVTSPTCPWETPHGPDDPTPCRFELPH